MEAATNGGLVQKRFLPKSSRPTLPVDLIGSSLRKYRALISLARDKTSCCRSFKGPENLWSGDCRPVGKRLFQEKSLHVFFFAHDQEEEAWNRDHSKEPEEFQGHGGFQIEVIYWQNE